MSDRARLTTQEIWMEILKNLPVKILGKCRCVSKWWNKLIISPPFMAAHLEHYTQNEANSFLLYKQFSITPKKQEQYTLFLDSAEGKEPKNLEISCTFTCPFVPRKSQQHFRVVGSVHGLICLSDDLFGYTFTILLWNPMIHRYIVLPIPRATYMETGAQICVLGFGYDSGRKDHKVVKLSYVRDSGGLDTTPPLVELYSVKEGKWRQGCADNLVNHCICDFWWSQCFLNKSIHWIAWEREAESKVFLRNWFILFDVEQEEFKRMKLPEAISQENTLTLSVSDYAGKLSVLHSVLKGGLGGTEMERCEIWVKREYNVGSSWSKMVSIKLDSSVRLRWVQCLRKNGEVLGFTNGDELVSYDLSRKKTKRLGIYGRWRSWFTGAYSESLILLDKKNGVGTYKEGRKQKKKRIDFEVDDRLRRVSVKEKEVDSSSDEDSEPSENNYHEGKVIRLEQLIKFDGGRMSRNLSEFMQMAGM